MDSHTMAYEMEGEGVPLVFIHQAATDRRIWQYQRSSLCRRYRMISVDVMGHGEGTWPPEELSLEYAAGHVKALLERLNAGPAFMIGVSMGAMIAMRIATANPLSVRGLILISPWSNTSGHTRNLVARLFRLAEAGDMSGHTDLFLRYILPSTSLDHPAPTVEHLRTLAMQQDAKIVAYTWAACMASDLSNCLGDVRAPCLIIAGANDLFSPPYMARAVAEAICEVELEIWEEKGHFPFIEDASRFNRRLEKFIRRCHTQTMSE
jgi:pimeloyl-ACP methyl ester carboxylesterase